MIVEIELLRIFFLVLSRLENNPDMTTQQPNLSPESQDKILSVSGRKKCSHCGEELGKCDWEIVIEESGGWRRGLKVFIYFFCWWDMQEEALQWLSRVSGCSSTLTASSVACAGFSWGMASMGQMSVSGITSSTVTIAIRAMMELSSVAFEQF